MANAKAKTSVLGTRIFIDKVTGDEIPMNLVMTEVPDKDANFYKLFLKDTLNALDIVSNRKTKVAYWLIDHMNGNNQIIYTYREIADACGFSYQTVANTIKILKDADFLRTTGKILIINPNMIYKGTAKRRAAVARMYYDAESGDETANLDERIDNLNKAIMTLTRQVAVLEKKRGANVQDTNTPAGAVMKQVLDDDSQNPDAKEREAM